MNKETIHERIQNLSLSVISNAMNIDMKSISIESNDGIFLGTITLEVKNKSQLEETLKQLRNVLSVTQVKRL